MSQDRQLLKDLQRGENAAWRRIYLKYKDDLLTVARSLVCDVNTAEDCLQEVFVSLVSDKFKVRTDQIFAGTIRTRKHKHPKRPLD